MTRPQQEYHPVQERAEATKNRILDQALELFSHKGYHGTNTKEIAAAAGLATGSFYRYFRDKKSVFLAVCSRMETGMQDNIFGYGRTLRARGLSQRDILEAVVNQAVQAHQQHRRFHLEIQAMQARDPEVAVLVRERQTRIRQRLLEFLRPIQPELRVTDLPTAVELIHLAVEEVAFQTVIMESPTDNQALRSELIEMLARYLLKNPERLLPESRQQQTNTSCT